jgi:hypothetical protein
MTQPPPIQRIDEWEMRKLFNEHQLWEKVQQGEFTSTVLESRIAPPNAEQPAGTVSQMLSYRDSANNEVARVHQYLKPDGTIGGKGRPDPKRVFLDGVLYRLVKNPQVKAEDTGT